MQSYKNKNATPERISPYCDLLSKDSLLGISLLKGQLISKGLFDVIVSTKKITKFFKDFCPSPEVGSKNKGTFNIKISLIRGYLT